MKRTVIFAAYDQKGIIHDYVLSYLKYLKEIANNIVFIADNEASPLEQEKLKDLCCHYEFIRHGEYDFGSYKRGFNWAKNNGLLDETDELILCNDSCFCIGRLVPVFTKMESVNCDFWGMTESKQIVCHLQSYFLVFKRETFTSSVFNKFMNNISKQVSSDDVIKHYELKLTSLLEENSFNHDAFIKACDNANPTCKMLGLMEKGDFLVKKKIFNTKVASLDKPRNILKKIKKISFHSYEDICKYYKRNGWCFFPVICQFYGFKYHISRIIRFFYQEKITRNNKRIIKICKIPVYSKRTYK